MLSRCCKDSAWGLLYPLWDPHSEVDKELKITKLRSALKQSPDFMCERIRLLELEQETLLKMKSWDLSPELYSILF